MTPDDLVCALKTVPEKKLRLVDLAWELATPEGELDLEKALAMTLEVSLASQEASAYVEGTRRVLCALADLAR